MTGWMQREFPINSKAHWFIYIFLFFPFFENDFSILFAEHTESFFYKMWGRFLKLAQISKKKFENRFLSQFWPTTWPLHWCKLIKTIEQGLEKASGILLFRIKSRFFKKVRFLFE